MNEKKMKEGVSIKEIESFTKKHRFEVFFCLAFILACFFSFVMWGTGWAMTATIIGAIVGILLHEKIDTLCKKALQFVFKQETMTQLVLAIVMLILAIVIPPIIFLLIGLHGGKDIYQMTNDHSQRKS